MKTIRFISFLLLLFCLNIVVEAQSNVTAQEDWKISLGKRKNNLLSREIREINLGNTFTSYNPVFFKVGDSEEWKKVGIRGAHILPYIPSNDFSENHFRVFKQKKTASYWCLGVSVLSYAAWGLSSLDFAIQNNSLGINSFVNPRSLAFLVGTIGCYAWGASLNAKADLELFMAFNSDKIKEEKEALSLHLGVTRSGGLGLEMAF